MAKLKGMKKVLSAVMAAVIVAVSITGCSSSSSSDETAKANGTTEASMAAEDKSGPAEKSAERIVSGYYITTSACIALGLEDKMVGIEAKAASRPIYKLAAPELLGLPSVGTAKEFDLEGCIALKPDLVILPKKLSEQADTLSGMEIPTLVVNPESMEGLEQTILDIAEATGTTDRAKALIGWYDQKQEKMKKVLEDSSTQEPLKIYIAGTSSILRSSTKEMYQNSLIEMAGGVNAAADLTDKGWADISYEQLIAYNPDVIVVIPEADYTKEDVLKDGQLAAVNAVKNSRVYEMPSSFEAWDSPVPSGILGGMWLSSILHEEGYPFEEFKEDAADFYREFYDVEIDTALITQ